MRRLLLALLFPFLLSATDVYVAQTAAGGNTGLDCADAIAYTATSFNAAGTTYHLCGTFSMAAGASGTITVGGSGTSGNLITIKFESGANATATYWGTNGFIYLGSNSYILVDGNNVGSIAATANGTGLANQQSTAYAVYANGGSNIEIRNLAISNIYAHTCSSPVSTCTDTSGGSTNGIRVNGGSNILIHGNTIHDSYTGITYNYIASTTQSNVQIYGNVVYNCNWHIQVGDTGASAILNSLSITQNDFYGYTNWNTTGDTFHSDGIFIWANNAGSQVNSALIDKNVSIDSSGLCCVTAWLYLSGNEGSAGSISGTYVTNNVFVNTSSTLAVADGMIYNWASNSKLYNNTVVNANNSAMVVYGWSGATQGTDGLIEENNIFQWAGASASTDVSWQNNAAQAQTTDYNDFYDNGTVEDPIYFLGTYYTLSAWQASAGTPDTHSSGSTPNLNASSTPAYQLTAASGAAYRTGVNLTSVCSTVAALCTDANGVPRPSTGAWDMGAFYFTSGTSPAAPWVIIGKIVKEKLDEGKNLLTSVVSLLDPRAGFSAQSRDYGAEWGYASRYINRDNPGNVPDRPNLRYEYPTGVLPLSLCAFLHGDMQCDLERQLGLRWLFDSRHESDRSDNIPGPSEWLDRRDNLRL